uniref:Peptidase_S15 domain-containing protein n=1 Tax=Macrostomum lignano TaxID=282301 RepID=A0A1I8HKC2_9PLAT
MSDGIRLAVRLWLPSNSGVISDQFPGQTVWRVYTPGEAPGLLKCPAVLEYLPYRKRRHHGSPRPPSARLDSFARIAVARADLRGCGDSERSLLGRELLGRPPVDRAWLAGQSWTNGPNWALRQELGGFNGLQLAEMGCPGPGRSREHLQLDDRFNSDIHYTGGCVIGTEALTWSSFMLAINSLPPSPAQFGQPVTRAWRDRLNWDGHRPWIDRWLRHQTPDDYWRRGSVRFRPEPADCPVLLIGGWHDLYSDALLRLADRLPNTASCALLGPWSHDWPDTAAPGRALPSLTSACAGGGCTWSERPASA